MPAIAGLPVIAQPGFQNNKNGRSAAGHPQGEVVPFEPVSGQSAWYAADYKDSSLFTLVLSEADILELDTAVASVLEKNIVLPVVTKEDFALPMLGPKLEQFRKDVQFGRGFGLVRGVPVHRYSRRETMVAYWGLGTYWGKAVSQNKKGHLIGHIKDIGHDPKSPETRLYATHEAQPYHNDAADLVALLALKPAKEGGLSSWSSSISVHNEILKRRPELAHVLAGPWYFDRKGEVPAGKKGFFYIPVFNYYKGYLSVNYSDNYFLLSQRHPEVPRLTQQHLEAMLLFNQLASSDELRLDFMLQPGDIQLLSNHTCLHARQAFVDFPDFSERRHLLRLWLTSPDDRPLPECYADLLGGSVVPGERGGIHVPGSMNHLVPMDAE